MPEEPTIVYQISRGNVPRNQGVIGNRVDEVGRGHEVVALLGVVAECLEADAQLVVALEEGRASRIQRLSSRC